MPLRATQRSNELTACKAPVPITAQASSLKARIRETSTSHVSLPCTAYISFLPETHINSPCTQRKPYVFFINMKPNLRVNGQISMSYSGGGGVILDLKSRPGGRLIN
jgi:hypothetical protein